MFGHVELIRLEWKVGSSDQVKIYCIERGQRTGQVSVSRLSLNLNLQLTTRAVKRIAPGSQTE